MALHVIFEQSAILIYAGSLGRSEQNWRGGGDVANGIPASELHADAR